jgi:AbrB family looped-hinge helix DNA binding protein
MTAQLTIDSAGRIVLPKPIRKELDIGPGDLLGLDLAFIWNFRHYGQFGPDVTRILKTP